MPALHTRDPSFLNHFNLNHFNAVVHFPNLADVRCPWTSEQNCTQNCQGCSEGGLGSPGGCGAPGVGAKSKGCEGIGGPRGGGSRRFVSKGRRGSRRCRGLEV